MAQAIGRLVENPDEERHDSETQLEKRRAE